MIDFPKLGVCEINHRERHLAVGPHIGVEGVGLDITHQRFVFDQINGLVAFLQVFNEHRLVKPRAKDLGQVGRVQHQLGFEQRRTIGEAGFIEGGSRVGHQEVPVPAQQVEAALLVDLEVGLRLSLALGPNIVATRLRVVGQVSTQIGHFAASDAVVGVNNAADTVGIGRRRKRALELLLAVVAIFKGEDFALERGAVGHRDFADSVF